MSTPISPIYDGQSFEDVADILNQAITRLNAIYDAVMSAKNGDGGLSAAQLAELPTINGVVISGVKSLADLGIANVTSYAQLDGKPSIPTIAQAQAAAKEVCISSMQEDIDTLHEAKSGITLIAFDNEDGSPVTVTPALLKSILNMQE